MIGLNEAYQGQAPTPDDSSSGLRIDLPQLVEHLFSPQGSLTQKLQLEHRPEQMQMAIASAQAFISNQPLLFEAGTGVGKSLAYLLPALVFAQESKRQAVVSSHTIALQEQILKKDLELCRALFRKIPALEPYHKFRTALLVGRGNYLCGTRLAQAIESRTELFPTAEQAELERIADWSLQTATGLHQELTPSPLPEVWDWVNADGSACNSRNCSPDTCFFRRALQQVRSANLVIVNHSLLFALLGGGHHPRNDLKGVLYPNDFVILDEAHRVPSIATEHFGERISSYGFNRLLSRLYSTKGRGKKARGLLLKAGNESERQAVRNAKTAADLFFQRIAEETLGKQDIVRCRESNWTDPSIIEPLKELHTRIGYRADQLEDGPLRDEFNGAKSLLGNYTTSIQNCISLADEEHVYWVEKTGRKRETVTLRSAPIDVSAHLRERLFTRKTSVVLTSATLASGQTMESFQKRTGSEGCTTEQVTSPFDFKKNTRIFLATDAPDYNPNDRKAVCSYLVDMIRFCTLRVRGGSLVLFTSYADLHQCAMELNAFFHKEGRPFYQQGRDGSRQELAARLHRDGNGILFGTESFWTGIDIPGTALSQVIITRLPFQNPSHPVAQARAEYHQTRGENPFQYLTLPDALVRFRQGIGRLIRRADDKGTITILDSRIISKSYGLEFISILPNPQQIRFSRSDRDEVFQPLETDH